METFGKITLHNGDCMDILKSLPDNAYDLAIVDPPYGLGDEKLTNGGTWASKYKKGDAAWDIKPPHDYFVELFRVSKNQIIWGGNYYSELPECRCFLIWDKITHMTTMADCEFAWTSFDKNAKIFEHARNTSEKRIHPTQKPVPLYKWILHNYAKPGDKILDTHLGSGSICIAAHDYGFEMLGIELSPTYYNATKKRLLCHQAQLGLF